MQIVTIFILGERA